MEPSASSSSLNVGASVPLVLELHVILVTRFWLKGIQNHQAGTRARFSASCAGPHERDARAHILIPASLFRTRASAPVRPRAARMSASNFSACAIRDALAEAHSPSRVINSWLSQFLRHLEHVLGVRFPGTALRWDRQSRPALPRLWSASRLCAPPAGRYSRPWLFQTPTCCV